MVGLNFERVSTCHVIGNPVIFPQNLFVGRLSPKNASIAQYDWLAKVVSEAADPARSVEAKLA